MAVITTSIPYYDEGFIGREYRRAAEENIRSEMAVQCELLLRGQYMINPPLILDQMPPPPPVSGSHKRNKRLLLCLS